MLGGISNRQSRTFLMRWELQEDEKNVNTEKTGDMNRPKLGHEARSIFTDDEDDTTIFNESPRGHDMNPYMAHHGSSDESDTGKNFYTRRGAPGAEYYSDQETEGDLFVRNDEAQRNELFPGEDTSLCSSGDRGGYFDGRTYRRRTGGPAIRRTDARRDANTSDGKENVADIYSELQQINDKMKREFKILHERDEVLKERERVLTEAESAVGTAKASLEVTVDLEVKRRLHLKEEEYRAETERLDQITREKAKENKRLKDNFDTLKMANDTLRRELESLQSDHEKMEKQATSLQARLANLQRKTEHDQRRENNDFLPPDLGKNKRQREVKSKASNGKVCSSTYDVLGVLLEWVADVNLRHLITEQPTKPLDSLSSPVVVQEKCIKVLPSLAEMIKDIPSSYPHLVLPCLQFIYWSLIHLDSSNSTGGATKMNLTSTLRRLGEELYKSRMVRFAEEDGSPGPPAPSGEKARDREGVYFRSPNMHVRLLSSLIIIKSLNQVDHLANVFEVLKTDLKSDTVKQLFLYYQGVTVITPYLRPTNKALLQAAVDVYLGMSMESPVLVAFLEACSSEAWFRAISVVMRMPNIEEKINEKLSILLQKLSKIKSNRRFFEVFGLTLTIQELHRAASSSNNAFLTLNLKSILFNLNVKLAGS